MVFSGSSIVAERLAFPFNVSTKTINRALTRSNQNQIENREESNSGVVGGLTGVLLRSIVLLIPQVGSLLNRNCDASNQSFGTSLSSIHRVAGTAVLSLSGMCFDCWALHKVNISSNLFGQ